MDSVARGLTALSPSIGQAEDFISKKGIPPDQVPAFLAQLGDPQLAGLIAQKQRLKQEQAKQVPPGGPQQSPPTVKDEINQQLAQIMQAKQQQQMGMPPQQGQPGQPPQGAMPPQGGQPPQPGQPPMPPQGGQPPVQAAAGGLMGMGIGGLDAGAMEAPRHFEGGGVVAFSGTTGSAVNSKGTVKDKDEIEGNTPAPDPVKTSYEDYYKSLEQQKKDVQAIAPYKMLDDPTFKERDDLLKKRQAKAAASYARSEAAARKAGWIAAMEAAGSGKSLFQTITAKVKTTEEKHLEAEKERDRLEDELDDKLIELHQAQQVFKETNNKAAYDRMVAIQKEIGSINDKLLGAKNEQAKFNVQQDKIDRDYNLSKDKYAWEKDKDIKDREWEKDKDIKDREWEQKKFEAEEKDKAATRALTARQITASSSTNEDRYAADYVKAAKARGDTRSDAELSVAGRKEYSLIGKDPTATTEKAELAGYLDYQKNVVGPAEESLKHQKLMHRSDPNHPDLVRAQAAVDKAKADALKLYPTAAGRLSEGSSGGVSGGSSGGVDTTNPLLR